MSEIKLNNETLELISTFESLTRAEVRDCFMRDDKVVFVVNNLKKALGKRNENVHKLKRSIGKNIDVIGYSSEPEKFIKNIFHNYRVRDVGIEEKNELKTAMVDIEPGDKGRAIGKNRRNLNLAEKILSHHFPIDKIYIR